ncbi:MAG: carbohydrate ABC transporter permease [Ktedonobacteraceae bacterium]
MLIWSLIVAIPLIIIVSIAVKSGPDLVSNPIGWPKQFVWSNFADAWNNANLGQAFENSVLITSISILILILCGASAAYTLARQTGAWSNRLYTYFVAGLIVPTQLGLIPLYKEMHDLQLINTYHGVVLVYVAGNLPLVIFLYTGFIKTVPRELEEAALMDGAGPLRIFWTIIFPLLQPITATVAITSSLSIWNDFFIPLLFLQKDEMHTLPMAIFSFVGQYNNNWPLIFASVIVSSLPLILLFLLLQRYFIKGIASGALKG